MNSFSIFFSILGVWLPPQFVWNLPRIFLSKECVYTLPLEFTMLSNHTYLKMRVSSECLLHVCDPEIVVQNSVLSLDFFLNFNGLLSRVQSMMDCCCCCRCRRCCFPGGRDFYRFVEATVSRCVLEGLTFVSTLFESCEPYSWYPTECLEDSKYMLSRLSSFLRNFWTEIHHPRIVKIHLELVQSIQWQYLYWVIILNSSCNFVGQNRRIHSLFCWSFSWALWQWNDASATAHEILDWECFIRAVILNNKNLYLCTNFIKPGSVQILLN